jgi:NAD(P)-dependent dehydrogenase (short-subunit alcohol dehydrogenase family)
VNDRLSGKVAIVTGAGSRGPGIGNGRAAAVLFARHGAKVLLVDGNMAAANETMEMIKAEKGVAAVHAPADVSESIHCEAAVASAIRNWGRLDVLVNNVGLGARNATVVDLPLEEWSRIYTINVQSMMLMCKYAIPEIAKSGGGAIINIGSISSLLPSRGNNAYATSKGAVVSFTRSIAVDHAKDGVRANCILPGYMATPMALANRKGTVETESQRLEREGAERKRRINASLLGIEGTGWDIGNAALFLASDESRYITGIDLLVDGGAALV